METILSWVVVAAIAFFFLGGFVVYAIVIAIAKIKGETFDP